MKKNLKMKKYYGIVLILAMIAGLVPAETTMAAKKVSISKKNLTLTAGKSATLKLKNIKKSKKSNVKWSSSKKSVVVVNKSGKITAKKKGTAKITARYAGKKYTCKVTVKAKTITKVKPTEMPSSDSISKPSITPTKKPDAEPNSPAFPKPDETPSVEKNYKKLIDYILEKGSDGGDADISYKAIGGVNPSYDSFIGVIAYRPENKTVMLLLQDKETDLRFGMEIDTTNFNSGVVVVNYIYQAAGKVDVRLLTGDGDKVTWVSSNAPTSKIKSQLCDVGDAALEIGLDIWDYILQTQVNLDLADIGFILYK